MLKSKENNPEAFRITAHKKRIKHSYGLEYEDYLKLLEEQKGLCKICSKDNSGRRLSIDHCHDTGRIRGLLCTRCNRALGLFEDNTELLIKAANYTSLTH